MVDLDDNLLGKRTTEVCRASSKYRHRANALGLLRARCPRGAVVRHYPHLAEPLK
jgi:hypothetical protein